MGELRPRDVRISEHGLERRRTVSRLRRSLQVLRRNRHLRRGHDPCCEILGTPRATVLRLLEHWGAPEAVGFVTGLFAEIESETASSGVNESIAELAEYLVRRRITPRAPERSGHAA